MSACSDRWGNTGVTTGWTALGFRRRRSVGGALGSRLGSQLSVLFLRTLESLAQLAAQKVPAIKPPYPAIERAAGTVTAPCSLGDDAERKSIVFMARAFAAFLLPRSPRGERRWNRSMQVKAQGLSY